MITYKFEKDLYTVKNLLEDYDFAQEVYAALCNRTWQSLDDPEIIFDCTWRYAAELITRIRDKGEDYLEFYPSNMHTNRIPEGSVTVQVYIMFNDLGWTLFEEEQYKFRYNNNIYTIWIKGIFIDNASWTTRAPDGHREFISGTENVLDYVGKNLPDEMVVKIHRWIFSKI